MSYEEKRAELLSKMEAAAKEHRLDDFNSLKNEVEKLDEEHDAEVKNLAAVEAMRAEAKPVDLSAMSVNVNGNAGAAVSLNAKAAIEPADIYDSIEYRKAFMNFAVSGTPIPAEFKNAAQQTTTSDVSAVIPTTVMRKIIEKLETVGKIWSRITKTNFKGGVSIPNSTIKPTAEWVVERGTQDTQKKAVGSISFTWHKLICKVAVSFETTVVTLDIFESTIINNITEAMIKKLELSVLNGTGAANNQPVGLLTQTPISSQIVNIAAADKLDFKTIVAAEAALPQAYDNKGAWVMTKPTFFNYIVGMVDSNKRPIMRELIGANGKPGYYILGREVLIVDNDYMASMTDSVTADTIVAFIYDFSNYVMNINYSMTLREYIDEDSDDRVKKSIMLADGKPVDINSLVVVKKLKA